MLSIKNVNLIKYHLNIATITEFREETEEAGNLHPHFHRPKLLPSSL